LAAFKGREAAERGDESPHSKGREAAESGDESPHSKGPQSG
jgi:hypothetical protein